MDALSPRISTPPCKPNFYRRFTKRALDTLLVLMAAPFVVPFVICFAILIALDGGSPFYSQMRVGKDGKRFRMWKLRSMVMNADQELEAYLEANPVARLEWDTSQKLKNDPRITRIGRFIRKTSIDELPQLFNVVRGDMSLVGPRPMMVDQESIYPGVNYKHLRPGITGNWQISDRNECTFRDRALFDDAYHRDLSFLTDVSILARTIGVVLRGTGY